MPVVKVADSQLQEDTKYDSSSTYDRAWSAFNTTQKQMKYIWPAMDKQLLDKDKHTSRVMQGGSRIEDQDSSIKIVVDGDSDRVVVATKEINVEEAPEVVMKEIMNVEDGVEGPPIVYVATFEIPPSFIDEETGWYPDTFIDTRATLKPRMDGNKHPIGKGYILLNL